MKRILALTGILCAPLSLLVAAAAVPKVLGILLALLQLGSNISFGDLYSTFTDLILFGGFLLAADFAFIL